NGEEGDAAGEPIERPGVDEPHRRSQHRRDLGVVAAGVRGAGLGIGLGMPRHDQRVQLPEDRECRPGARPPPRVRADRPQAPPDILLPRNGLRCILGGMDYHHVLEASGVVVFGLVFYSYTFRWFHPKGRLDARWRPVLTGLAFGVLTVVLMISRIRVDADLF